MEYVALAAALTGIVGAIVEQVSKPYASRDPGNADASRAVEAGQWLQAIATFGAKLPDKL